MADSTVEKILLEFSSSSSNGKSRSSGSLSFDVTNDFSLPFLNSSSFAKRPFILVTKKRKTENHNEYDFQDGGCRCPSSSAQISPKDLAGSPLKFSIGKEDFSLCVDDSSCKMPKDEEPLKPLGLKDARVVMANYNRCNKNNLLPLKILCDGERNDIVLIGSEFVPRGLRWSCVSLDSEYIKLDLLKEKHFRGLKNKKIDAIHSTSSFNLSHFNCELGQADIAIVSLDFRWNSCSQLYEPPPQISICEMSIEGKPNSTTSPVYKYHEEINLLEKIMQNQMIRDTSVTSEEIRTETKKKLEDLIADLKTKRLCNHKFQTDPTQTGKNGLGSDDTLKFLATERAFDLTDHLWNLLKNHSDSRQLIVDSMEYLLANQKQLQHTVFKNNKTTLARFLNGSIPKPFLSEMIALQFLTESGLEKIRRDYIWCFNGSEIASREEIEKYFESCTTQKQVIDHLRNVYCVLYLITLCFMVLQMSVKSLRAYFKIVWQMITKNSIFNFKYQIPTENVMHLVENLKPVTWQMIMSSREDNYEKSTMYTVCRTWPSWLDKKGEDENRFIMEEITAVLSK